jgi:hypothetical protein
VPLPVGLSTVTVSGTYKHPDGTAMSGKLLFTPEPAILTSGTHGTLVLGTIEATLDANGAVTATLLATDDADVTPTGWTYLVQERWYDAPGRSYPLSLPAAAPAVDLADVAPTAPAEGVYVVVTGPQPALGAAGAGPTIALRSDDPSTVNARTPTAHASTHAAAGSDPVTLTQAQITGLVAALAEKAALAGATFTGAVSVNGADFSVVSTTKGYRFRRGGGALDLEGTGADLIVSVWSGTGFDGTQRSYDRYSADALNVQHAGKREFVSALYGATVHTIDPDGNRLGFHGKAPVSQQAVTGSRGGNAALASLLTALDTLGIIDDQTTA